MDCIFCKIANGEIPSNKVYEDDTVLAFYDLEPQAPSHILVIPKMHITSAADVTPENSGVIAHIFEVIAKIAKEQGAEYFATTLTISPLKNAQKLNEIGERLAEEYGVKYLPSDFKKKNGYKRSVELSAQYELYRQNYCGCVFSKMQAERNA